MLKIWNLLFGPAKVYGRPVSENPWDSRTREEKRQSAPYALGWEEGYVAAYQIFLNDGVVPHPNWHVH